MREFEEKIGLINTLLAKFENVKNELNKVAGRILEEEQALKVLLNEESECGEMAIHAMMKLYLATVNKINESIR